MDEGTEMGINLNEIKKMADEAVPLKLGEPLGVTQKPPQEPFGDAYHGYPYHPGGGVCPHCGYCPTCGRPWMWNHPSPWYSPVYCGTGGTTNLHNASMNIPTNGAQ